MTLKDNLYTIAKAQKSDDGRKWEFLLQLNSECFIYKAHFPDMPITPGVCIVQIVKELLERSLDCTLKIGGIKNVKFLAIMQPERQNVSVMLSNIKVDSEKVSAQALVSDDNGVNYAKVSLQTIIA